MRPSNIRVSGRNRFGAARLLTGLLAATVLPLLCEASTRRPGLSLEERIAAQRAIEQVYWNLRIWPKENPGPKPPLSAVLPDAAIRAWVEDTLRKSNALEKYWHRPITAEQLQAELNRMAAHTRDPRLLQEVFAALGNDPRLIAETLARQALVNRLIRNWYATDDRFHRTLKKKAEAALAACHSVKCMPSMGGDYRETIWKLSDGGAWAGGGARTDRVSLQIEEWNARLAQLALELGGAPDSLPVLKLSGLEETSGAFAVSAVLSQGKNEVGTAMVIWGKVPFDAWWLAQRSAFASYVEDIPQQFTLPPLDLEGCASDTWAPTAAAVFTYAGPGHTAVWTGTEMIVWGGGGLNTGARYAPSTDAWTPTSTGANAPPYSPGGHSAVWTGTEMIVWGGGNWPWLNTGGRYNPLTDTWMPTSTGSNVPDGRPFHTAVWTGTKMIVWGGGLTECSELFCVDVLNTGGRYDPSSDTWLPTSIAANVPEARNNHTAVWTGTEMIVWGGENDSGIMNTGGRYDPSSDTWTPTSLGANVPLGRGAHTAVWTGNEMIIWGGFLDAGTFRYFNTGGRFTPSTDTWTPTSTGPNVPAERYQHSAVWTGTEMIIWGGIGYPSLLNTGGRYDASTDTWTSTSTAANVPPPRYYHTAVWTGQRMIVWGDQSADDDGGLYCACPNGTLYYRDVDGDGYGDPGVVGTSCDGAIPAGNVANHTDCNDASASVNPGALEICNTLDDDCNGSVDDATLPGSVAAVTMAGDAESIEWTPLAVAQTYDLVYGDVAQLRSTGGDFTPATLGCLAHDTAATSAVFSTVPQIGQALWGLVRGRNCVGNGTYDSGDPGQVGSRDAEIAVSPHSCGAIQICGDNVCNGSEVCNTCAFDCGICPCVTDDDCQPATCCFADSCIPIWVPQSCPYPVCEDDPGFITCVCQNGACVGFF